MNGKAFGRLLVALLAGAIFSFGLSVSGMIDPARVIGFLNLAGPHWDPSLLFVLGGAVLVALPGVLLQRKIASPFLDERFYLPESTEIDARLVMGSAIFGIGWGIAGLCPGPAVAAISLGLPSVFLFVIAMVGGMVLYDRFLSKVRS